MANSKPQTQEHIIKRTSKLKNKEWSQSHKDNFSKARKGISFSQERNLKISKNKIGIKRGSYAHSENYVKNTVTRGTKVQCLETGEIYNSINEANRILHCDICAYLKGRQKTANGCHWVILEEK